LFSHCSLTGQGRSEKKIDALASEGRLLFITVNNNQPDVLPGNIVAMYKALRIFSICL